MASKRNKSTIFHKPRRFFENFEILHFAFLNFGEKKTSSIHNSPTKKLCNLLNWASSSNGLSYI